MIKNAVLDDSRKYRYLLSRQWGNNNNFINFILLNPSTADEHSDDPTIKACIKIAQNNGFDGIHITNLFAFRATKPNDLKLAEDPIGLLNDQFITEYAKKSKIIVVAWGNHGNFLNRNIEVINLISKIKPLHCLHILKNGNPKHPLYVKRDTKLIKI